MRMKLRLGQGRRKKRRESETGSSVTVGFVSPTLFHTLHPYSPPPHPPAFLQGGGPSQRTLLSPPSSLSDLLSSDHTLGSPQGEIQNKGGKKKAGTQKKVPEEGGEQLFPHQGRGPLAM